MLRLLMIHHERQEACRRFRRSGHDQDGHGQTRSVVRLVKGQHAKLHAVYDESAHS
jgi:hypothetical protein